jgi:hypothetical protein
MQQQQPRLLRRHLDRARPAGGDEIGQAAQGLVPNLAKETITIPMSLTDFATAYEKFK